MLPFENALKEIKQHMTPTTTADEVRDLLKKHSGLPETQHDDFITWLSQLGE